MRSGCLEDLAWDSQVCLSQPFKSGDAVNRSLPAGMQQLHVQLSVVLLVICGNQYQVAATCNRDDKQCEPHILRERGSSNTEISQTNNSKQSKQIK